MTTFQSIVVAITGNAFLLAVLGWLAKSLLQNLLTKDLAEHRVRLESDNRRAAQAFEHELSMTAREHDIRFGKLHERRAETIAKLYEFLALTSEKGAAYSSPFGYSSDPPKLEQFIAFASAYNDAATFFYTRKLFLPEQTCERVEELFRGMKEHPSKMKMYMSMADQHSSSNMELKKLDAWNEAWKYFQEDFKPAMATLESDFRSLLGDLPARATNSSLKPTPLHRTY